MAVCQIARFLQVALIYWDNPTTIYVKALIIGNIKDGEATMHGPKNQKIVAFYNLALTLLAVAVILGAVLSVLAYESIYVEKDRMTRILIEKGSTFIRYFQAHFKAGMMNKQWDLTQVQELANEIAEESDIQYVILADVQGKILVHSNAERVDTTMSRAFNFTAIPGDAEAKWRIHTTQKGRKVFEVAQEIIPVKSRNLSMPVQSPGRYGVGMRQSSEGLRPDDQGKAPEFLLFVGLPMEALESSLVQAKRNAILTIIILLLAGSSAIFAIYVIQSHRAVSRAYRQIQTYAGTLVSNLPHGLIAVDKEANITVVNRKAQEMLGRDEESLKGLPLDHLIPVESFDIRSLMTSSNAVHNLEIEVPRAGVSSMPVSLSATRLSDEDGSIPGAVIIFRDLITVKRLQEELHRNELLMLLGSVTEGFVHKIHNPLRSIKSLAADFGGKFKAGSHEHQYATIIAEEVDRIDQSVSQLLEFANLPDTSFSFHS